MKDQETEDDLNEAFRVFDKEGQGIHKYFLSFPSMILDDIGPLRGVNIRKVMKML